MAVEALPSATWLDETLLAERERLVAVRFGRASDPLCRAFDAQLAAAAAQLPPLRVYSVDLDCVPDFTAMYELYDPCTLVCFHRSRPLLVDAGFGPTRALALPLPRGGSIGQLLAQTMVRALGDRAPAEAVELAGGGAGAGEEAWGGEAGEWLHGVLRKAGGEVEAARRRLAEMPAAGLPALPSIGALSDTVEAGLDAARRRLPAMPELPSLKSFWAEGS
ncbi:hypothetical protein AB1Y20_017019 [Prymnesium parvum]|uniref:Thioredoxin-like protein n=1 Tax=Prymnesium parvum TaxID=97485 RepID=A0AB34IC49_PRYPA